MQTAKDIAALLREKGFRLTPQRLMIVSALEKSEGHISAEEIYAQVCSSFPQVNISTVYRTLELLKKLGLVMETDLGEGRLRYHCTDRGHHHHLLCQKCGARIELDEAFLSPLGEALQRQYNFNADLRHLAILGRCGRCS